MNPLFDDGDDETFLLALRELAAHSDPVPAAVTDFAYLAPSLIPLDVRLAELVNDNELAASSGLRDSEGRQLTFVLDDTSVVLDLTNAVVVGEFDRDPWTVTACYRTMRREVPVDRGVFVFRPEHRQFALEFQRKDERIATDWLFA